jgi:multimeric flavodoxin WrbA
LILGIGASGRNIVQTSSGILLKGVTEELVKYILLKTGEPFEYISLAGKEIYGCQGCLRCASDNICKVEDDWGEILDKVFEADAIVFGAPIYYGTINAIGQAFLERFFSLRHRDKFRLIGKANVIVTVGVDEPNMAEEYIKKIFSSNYMSEPVGILRSQGISQCYTCGFGENCTSGGVVRRHGFLDEIKDYHIPKIPTKTYREARKIAKRLSGIIKENFGEDETR